MPSSKDAKLDALLDDIPYSGGARVGFPWAEQLRVESSKDGSMSFDSHEFRRGKSQLSGRVKVDGSSSIQKTTAGPLVEHDSPTGLVPSTIFTPFPRDMLGIDYDYVELAITAAMAAALGAITSGLLASG